MSMPTTEAIIGREAELQRLRDCVQGPGRPVVAFLEGDAGVGKTALLEATVAEAEAAGTRVLRARPTAAEAGSSFAALDDLLRPAIEGLPRLAEPQRRALAAALLLEATSDPVDPRQVGLAALALLDGLPGPVLLAVDDWQWLDAASATVLSFVLRRLEPGGAKVIATVRSGEADEARRRVGARAPGRPGDHASRWVRSTPVRSGGSCTRGPGAWMPPPALARLHAACDGNPLMALELVRAPGAEAATDIRRLLARRVGKLSPDTRAALRFVAALSEPTLEAVETAMGSAGGLEEALAADVIVREGRRLRFGHPLIAAVVQERTPLGEWRAIHARLAELTDGPEQRARHLAAASEGPDEDVAAALEAAAGEAATRGATMAAADLAERAAQLTPARGDALRLRRLIAAAEAAMIVGDGQARPPPARGGRRSGRSRAAARGRVPQARLPGHRRQRAAAGRRRHSARSARMTRERAEIELSASKFAAMSGRMPPGAASRGRRRAACGSRGRRRACSPRPSVTIAFIRHECRRGPSARDPHACRRARTRGVWSRARRHSARRSSVSSSAWWASSPRLASY